MAPTPEWMDETDQKVSTRPVRVISATGLSELLALPAIVPPTKRPLPVKAGLMVVLLLACTFPNTSTWISSVFDQLSVDLEPLPPLVLIGEPLISHRSALVDPTVIDSPAFQRNLTLLRKKCQEQLGAGIAAPQIGWNASVFVVGVDDKHPKFAGRKMGAFGLTEGDIPLSFWINPTFTSQSSKLVYSWEGCMSVPGKRGWVGRPADITIAGYDHRGLWREQTFTGLTSRLVQHEAAHLRGSLFVDVVQGPQWIMSKKEFANQRNWRKGWPSPGAQRTPPGVISEEF